MSVCYCDDYDRPEFYIVEMRKARKPHKCLECRNIIAPGEVYENTRGKWSGYAPQSFKTCPRCCALRMWVERNIPCVCWSHGDMLENARDAIAAATDRAAEETKGLKFEFWRKYHSVVYHGKPKYRYQRCGAKKKS
jgi:hypothetical protein